MGECFIVDLHSDFSVYFYDPEPYIPKRESTRGRDYTRYRTNAKNCEVKKIIDSLDLGQQPVLQLRDTTRGALKVRALRLPVYVWDGMSSLSLRFFLLATQTVGPATQIKISLCNAPEHMALERLAWMQLQGYWMERAFENAKNECGMADHQVRKWSAWQHHMALVMMAMLFVLSKRIRHKDTYPLLSCSDIEELQSHFLPRRDVTKEEIIQQLEQRHRKRLCAIKSHSRKNELPVALPNK